MKEKLLVRFFTFVCLASIFALIKNSNIAIVIANAKPPINIKNIPATLTRLSALLCLDSYFIFSYITKNNFANNLCSTTRTF